MNHQKPGHLSKRQKLVIEDILKNGLSESDVLEKHKISPCRYRKWLENDLFVHELDARAEAVKRQIHFTLLHSQAKVMEKLVNMIDQEKGETARKLCLDLIELRKSDIHRQIVERIHSRLAI